MRSCFCCCWVPTFKERNWRSRFNFDPIISLVIRISFSWMGRRHRLNGGEKPVWWKWHKSRVLGDISPNPSCYIVRPKYWRDSKSIPSVAAVGIKQLIQEYLGSSPSNRNSSNNPRRGLHPSYSHCSVTIIVIAFPTFISKT